MELAKQPDEGQSLSTLVVPPRRIGDRTFAGRIVVVRALHVTY